MKSILLISDTGASSEIQYLTMSFGAEPHVMWDIKVFAKPYTKDHHHGNP